MQTTIEVMFTQEPVWVQLGLEKVWVGAGPQRRYEEVKHEMVLVPILSTLEKLFQKEDILRQVHQLFVYFTIHAVQGGSKHFPCKEILVHWFVCVCVCRWREHTRVLTGY